MPCLPGGANAICRVLDATRLRFGAKTRGHVGLGMPQPEHRIGMVLENRSQAIQEVRHDLVDGSEATQHQRVVGQPVIGSPQRRGGELARGVRRQVARIDAQDALLVPALRRRRNAVAVGQDVVVGTATERSGVAEKIDLHRGRPARERFQHLQSRVAVEVEQDVDGVVPNAFAERIPVAPADVNEAVRGARDACGDVVRALGTDGVDEHFHLRAIEALQQADDEAPHRMIPKIGRDEAEAETRPLPGAR